MIQGLITEISLKSIRNFFSNVDNGITKEMLVEI